MSQLYCVFELRLFCATVKTIVPLQVTTKPVSEPVFV
jgi:hypothetical protein